MLICFYNCCLSVETGINVRMLRIERITHVTGKSLLVYFIVSENSRDYHGNKLLLKNGKKVTSVFCDCIFNLSQASFFMKNEITFLNNLLFRNF